MEDFHGAVPDLSCSRQWRASCCACAHSGTLSFDRDSVPAARCKVSVLRLLRQRQCGISMQDPGPHAMLRILCSACSY